MKFCDLCFCVLALTVANIAKHALCARILAAIATPSFSHQRAFRPLWRELSSRGHEIVLLTTDVMTDENLTNLREIDLRDSYGIFTNFTGVFSLKESFRPLKMIDSLWDMSSKLMEYQLGHPEVQAILTNQSETFDIAIVEYLSPFMAALSTRFDCPFIGVVSLDAHYLAHDFMGNPVHPMLYPNSDLASENLTFFERLKIFVHYVAFKYYLGYLFNNVFNKGVIELMHLNSTFSMEHTVENMKLLFVNANPVFYNTRPLVPATVNLAGNQHIEKPKPLPKVCYSNEFCV